jgi:hypothetical protein
VSEGELRRVRRTLHVSDTTCAGLLIRRLGEFAHLFYAFLRVAGIESRYIWNRCAQSSRADSVGPAN